MDPLWYVAAAIVVAIVAPFLAIGLYQRRRQRMERQLARRKKQQIRL